MSFLDNLENNLKALESREEKDPEKQKRDQERRDAQRSAALARAPYAAALKNSAFTSKLLTECRAMGRGQRVLVQFVWLGEKLRLEAAAKRLELEPTEQGVMAGFFVDGVEKRREPVDLDGDPTLLARQWLIESRFL